MYIIPLTSLPNITAIGEPQPIAPQRLMPKGLPFADVLAEAVRTTQQTKEISSQGNTALALGQTDDLHNIQIDSLKAATALDLTTGLATKAITAYNEIMRMSI